MRLPRLPRVHRLVLRALGVAMPAICWAFLLVGVVGAAGSAAGLLPPFGHSWWGRVTTVLLWLVLAKEGYDPLAERGES